MRGWQVATSAVVLSLLIWLVIFTLTFREQTPQAGAFYYVWYNPADSASWVYPKIIDKPVLGYYNSCDPAVIVQHFAWLSDLHIDFIIVSWWGIYNQSDWHSFIDTATAELFETARVKETNVKIAIMVEPFNESGCYNFTEIYEHVYANFFQKFPSEYYKVDGKPLICFFNDKNMTSPTVFQKKIRFTVKIVGNDATAEWQYDSVTKKNNPPTDMPFPRDRQISIGPRFDDFYVRPNNETVDAKLEYLYAQQWENALNLTREGELDFIIITSWNEYPERTAIGPHYDATASNSDPYYLFNKTKNYIMQLHALPKLKVKIHTPFTILHREELGAELCLLRLRAIHS
ncbi:MAG: hypothetical protein QXU99_02685 [Candidatus Bathyarchaeia archaeon]